MASNNAGPILVWDFLLPVVDDRASTSSLDRRAIGSRSSCPPPVDAVAPGRRDHDRAAVSSPSSSIPVDRRMGQRGGAKDEPADEHRAVTDRPPDGTRWMRYVWLVYLGALFFQPVMDPKAGLLDWAVVVALIAAFLPLYVAGYRAADDRQLLLIVGAMAALGLAGSLINGGASVFVIYAAAAAAYLEPARRAVLVIVALVGVLALMMAISPVPLPLRLLGVAPALIFTIVTGAANIFDAERERVQRRLRRAEEEIERLAALAERERIARDLHDLLGHTLSVIVVKSELAARLAEGEPTRAGDEMRDVERIGREALAEVRAAVVGYRAKGCAASLTARGGHWPRPGSRRRSRLTSALPMAHESALALALRESVTNIVRHADARHATIRIGAEASERRPRRGR